MKSNCPMLISLIIKLRKNKEQMKQKIANKFAVQYPMLNNCRRHMSGLSVNSAPYNDNERCMRFSYKMA